MDRMFRRAAVLAVVVWAGSCFYRSYDEPARIVFVRNISGVYQIVTANDDGSDEKVLTNSAANNNYPSWSSNGESILFSRAGQFIV